MNEKLKYLFVSLTGGLLLTGIISTACETQRTQRPQQPALPASSVSGTPDPAHAVQQSPPRTSFMPDGGLPPQAVPAIMRGLTRVELNVYIAICAVYRYPHPAAITHDEIKALTGDRLAEIRDALISLQTVRKQNVNGRIVVTRPKFLTMTGDETYRPEVGFPVVME
jgi:hypothetical protein